MLTLLAWGRQPTTVAGISAFIATGSALVLNQLSWSQAVPVLIGAAVSIVLPDNSQAKQAAENLAADLITGKTGQ